MLSSVQRGSSLLLTEVVLNLPWTALRPILSPLLSRYDGCPSGSRPPHSSPFWNHLLGSGDKEASSPPLRSKVKAPPKAHFLIPFKGLIPLILINTGPGVRSNHPTDLHIIWLSILNFMKPPALFLTQTSEFPFRSRPPFPLHSTSPGASFLPPLLFCACPHMPALSNTKMPWRLYMP